MNESDAKLKLKKSVARCGGISFSLNSSFHTGLPDLYISLPERIPILVECKIIKNPTEKFNLKINYSDRQIKTLEELNAVQEGSAWGGMFIVRPRDVRFYLLHYTLTRIGYANIDNLPCAPFNPKLRLFELDKLVKKSNIPFVSYFNKEIYIKNVTRIRQPV